MFLSSHHINLCKIEIENIISRRIERLLDILRSNKKVLFIFCNEHAIYRKDFRDKTKLYYEQLKEISNILKQKFKRRTIKELEGKYKGPKKLKASGKAAGIKKKIEPKKVVAEKIKIRHRDQKNIGKRRTPTIVNPSDSQDQKD